MRDFSNFGNNFPAGFRTMSRRPQRIRSDDFARHAGAGDAEDAVAPELVRVDHQLLLDVLASLPESAENVQLYSHAVSSRRSTTTDHRFVSANDRAPHRDVELLIIHLQTTVFDLISEHTLISGHPIFFFFNIFIFYIY